MGRHLVVIDKEIEKPLRNDLKRHRKPDVDVVHVDDLDEVCASIDSKQTELDNAAKATNGTFDKWDTVSLIFNGKYNEEKQHISVMGVKLRVDVLDDRFMSGARYEKFKTVLDHLTTVVRSDGTGVNVHNGIYLYASNLGCIPGVQQILKGVVPQVYVSTNITGNEESEDWEVEWGSKDWYVLSHDQRKHAKRHLFSKLSRVALTLG